MSTVDIFLSETLNFRFRSPHYLLDNNSRRRAGNDMHNEMVDEMFDDPNRIPIGQAVRTFFKLVQEVRETKQRKILTKNGRALVAISPLTEVALVEAVQRQEKEDSNA